MSNVKEVQKSSRRKAVTNTATTTVANGEMPVVQTVKILGRTPKEAFIETIISAQSPLPEETTPLHPAAEVWLGEQLEEDSEDESDHNDERSLEDDVLQEIRETLDRELISSDLVSASADVLVNELGYGREIAILTVRNLIEANSQARRRRDSEEVRKLVTIPTSGTNYLDARPDTLFNGNADLKKKSANRYKLDSPSNKKNLYTTSLPALKPMIREDEEARRQREQLAYLKDIAKKLVKGGWEVLSPEEREERDKAPMEGEEMIINICELADHLTSQKLTEKYGDFKLEEVEAEYATTYEKYVTDITLFKRNKNG